MNRAIAIPAKRNAGLKMIIEFSSVRAIYRTLMPHMMRIFTDNQRTSEKISAISVLFVSCQIIRDSVAILGSSKFSQILGHNATKIILAAE